MEIYVINPFQSGTVHFPIVGMISEYHSMIWNVQLYALGYFELTVPATQDNINLLSPGKFLVRSIDIEDRGTTFYNDAMVIRTSNVTYDADQGYLLTVSGKSVKDILSQRVVWSQTNFDDLRLNAVIYTLIQNNIVDPVGYAQNTLTTLENGLPALETARQNAADDYDDAVSTYGADSPEAEAALEVLTAAQEAVSHQESEISRWTAILSQQDGRAIPYITNGIIDIPDESNPQITAQLYGESIGEWLENICTENRIGWKMSLTPTSMSVSIIVGTDRTSTVIFSPEMDNLISSNYLYTIDDYSNCALVGGEGEGIEQTTAEVALQGNPEGYSRYESYISATGLSSNNGDISLSNYRKMLQQYGKSELMHISNKESFSAEIDVYGVFKIGTDFSLGDKVTISNGLGVQIGSRLIELIYSEDGAGSRTDGTFEEWEG